MYHFMELGKVLARDLTTRMADEVEFHPAHCRSARALVGWTQAELAAAAGVGRMTVKRFESGDALRPAQAKAIRGALEGAGVAIFGDGAALGDRTVRIGVAMVSGREPPGWTPGPRVAGGPDEPASTLDD